MFTSRVLYTEPLEARVHVQVEAWVTEPEKASAQMANQFYFTFSVKGKTIRNVLPGNIDQGRQMAMRMQADKEQAA